MTYLAATDCWEMHSAIIVLLAGVLVQAWRLGRR